MVMPMHRNKSVSSHQFAMVPKADIPRSAFRMQKTVKDSFDSGWLVPVLCEEVLPGDTFNVRMTAFCRLATPLFPFLDNVYLESFFFFVPNRLAWTNWQRFMGEQANPADSISFVVPQCVSPVGGYVVGSLADHFGLPTVGQIGGGNTFTHNALPFRGYALIYNAWFRDENLQNSAGLLTNDGPDNPANYVMLRRGKRHDYFTSCLPFVQKGLAVGLPLGVSAAVKTSVASQTGAVIAPIVRFRNAATGGLPGASVSLGLRTGTGDLTTTATAPGALGNDYYPENLYADLSTATAATINQLRQAFQIQKLLERDARGGTRYTEIVRSHFGVISPDARLQRPEYLGGGRSSLAMSAVPQTSASGLTGGTTKLGDLAATGTITAHGHGFSQSFTEHGYVIGLVNVRADLTYQQGLRKMWSRSTRYDFYFPVFAMLGEQAVLNKEIYCVGTPAQDDAVFGYQERWAEYRYDPSEIRGLLKSTAAGTLDAWHLSQRFTALPLLNDTFIQETPPIARVIAVPTAPHWLCDMFFDIKAARPLPLYSVPGLIDHF